ncbi:hypothetical protein MMC15_000123 [Xylographa vitiligo]|nr:hypothetical protein [Xylographa vitiligo]
MASQRYAGIYIFYILIILFHWHESTQALALPASSNADAKFTNTAPTTPSHRATCASAVISNGNTASSTKLLSEKTPPSEQCNLSSTLDIAAHISKFARALTATSTPKVDFVSTPGPATRTQPANRSSATTALTPPRTSSTSYLTTLRTVATRLSTTITSTQPYTRLASVSTLSTSRPNPPVSTSASPTTTALLPQNLPLSLLIPLILVLAIIVILLFLLIRSSRPAFPPTHRQPRSDHTRASPLLEVPSTESTVVTCQEVYELPGSTPWGGWEWWGKGPKELDAGLWIVEMG